MTETMSRHLKGRRIAITGRLQNLTNNEAREVVEDEGGEPVQQIDENTDYLVIGDQPGEELLREAQENEVVKLTEDSFIDLLKGA